MPLVLRSKVVVVGDATVGKTALVQMAVSGGVTFPKNYVMTMGCDFCVKDIAVDRGTSVELSIFDISGQDLYRHNIASYLEQVNAFIVVYDITVKTSFEAANKWVTLIRKIPGNENALGILVANKVDLRDKAEVQDVQGEVYARNHKMLFFQASALRGVGAAEPLLHIAKDTAERYAERVRSLTQLSA